MNRDDAAWLAVRQPAYLAMNVLFGSPLKEPMLDALCSDSYQAIFGLCGGSEGYGRRFAQCLLSVHVRVSSDEGELDGIEQDRVRLFLGPTKPKASPWSSMHRRPGDGTLFNPATLVVRSYYLAEGYLPKDYPRVSDDHIALMMDFLAALSAESARPGSADEGKLGSLTVQRDFISRELLTWVEEFAILVGAYDRSGLYGGAASFLVDFLKDDLSHLDALIARMAA